MLALLSGEFVQLSGCHVAFMCAVNMYVMHIVCMYVRMPCLSAVSCMYLL